MKGDHGLFCSKCRFYTYWKDGSSECTNPKRCCADSEYKNEDAYWRRIENRY